MLGSEAELLTIEILEKIHKNFCFSAMPGFILQGT
jgi:hypothetical protein